MKCKKCDSKNTKTSNGPYEIIAVECLKCGYWGIFQPKTAINTVASPATSPTIKEIKDTKALINFEWKYYSPFQLENAWFI